VTLRFSYKARHILEISEDTTGLLEDSQLIQKKRWMSTCLLEKPDKQNFAMWLLALSKTLLNYRSIALKYRTRPAWMDFLEKFTSIGEPK